MQPDLPDHNRETISDIDSRLAALEAERTELLAARETVRKLNQGTARNAAYPATGRAGGDAMAGCPLTTAEMVSLRDRYAIIRAMAERTTDGRIHVGQAARWLHGAGIVKTVPQNLAKSLARRMRGEPDIWESLGGGWFRLIDHQGVQDSDSDGDSTEQYPS